MIRLMSYCAIAIAAAQNAVNAPDHAITLNVTIAPSAANSGYIRATRYTPAVTIVAAWINADTGVGPSIASGSQVYRNSWALFPNAPAVSSSGITTTTHVPPIASPRASTPWATIANSGRSSTVPNTTNTAPIAISSPRSPMRFMMNAFFAAATASGFL